MDFIGRVPHNRQLDQADVRPQSFFPVLQVGLKAVAVWAAIPEYFGNFDLIWRAAGSLSIGESLIVIPLLILKFHGGCHAGSLGGRIDRIIDNDNIGDGRRYCCGFSNRSLLSRCIFRSRAACSQNRESSNCQQFSKHECAPVANKPIVVDLY